ncbi:MAG: pentapeptide repeat-containing protein [Rhizobiales bacterium]|nr:pentapeptide repeat-containing protein [Hyphomicrobiales bacterium]
MSEPKTPESQEAKPIREIDEQTQKHIDRFLEGREVWNKWAEDMLVRKEELEKAGKWKVDRDVLYGNIRSLDKREPKIQSWLDEAFVNFSNLKFKNSQVSVIREFGGVKEKNFTGGFRSQPYPGKYIDFDGFIFPSDVSFENSLFNEDVYFCNAIFKAVVSFSKAIFDGGAHFGDTRFIDVSIFEEAIFIGSAYFNEAKFISNVSFRGVIFEHGMQFSKVRFKGVSIFKKAVTEDNAFFGNARFFKSADFSEIVFKRRAFFGDVVFKSKAIFHKSVFLGDAYFHKICVSGNAHFSNADFEKNLYFAHSQFKSSTNFEAILVKRSFNLEKANFIFNIPDFSQANFAESPRLDNIQLLPAPSYEDYPVPSKKIQSPLKWQRYWWNLLFRAFLFRAFWRSVYKLTPSNYRKLYHKGEVLKHIWNKFTNNRRNPNEEAHYRALKRLAIQAHDHENEMKFFAGEIRSRRHITDCLFPWKKGFASSARYWAGVFYELFSDFGRSFIRPTLWWFACLWLFANLTLSGAGLVDKTKCHNSQLTPKEAAYTIGLKNSLLILGLTKTNIVKQAELCLYGLNKNGANKNVEVASNPKPYDLKIKRTYEAKSAKVENTKTDIPFKAAVQGIVHSLLSLLFIFLLLLAIRNQFKIK